MLLNVITCFLLVSTCLGSQIHSLIQKVLVSNGTGLPELLSNGTGLSGLAEDSAEEIFKNFVASGSKKPEDVTKILKLLEALVTEANGNLNVLNNKVTVTLAVLSKAKKDATAAETKVKVDEAKKVAKAQQAHDDAKATRNKEKPGIDHELAILKKVIDYLWPLSTRQLQVSAWTGCRSTPKCKYGKVCMGDRDRDVHNSIKHLMPGRKYTVTLDFIPIYSWDMEWGYIYVNGKKVWSKQFNHSQIKTGVSCGSSSHGYSKKVAVTLTVAANNQGRIDIRGKTNLDSRFSDESYGVSNLKVKKA